jgi:hypothetical protein
MIQLLYKKIQLSRDTSCQQKALVAPDPSASPETRLLRVKIWRRVQRVELLNSVYGPLKNDQWVLRKFSKEVERVIGVKRVSSMGSLMMKWIKD